MIVKKKQNKCRYMYLIQTHLGQMQGPLLSTGNVHFRKAVFSIIFEI